MATATKPATGRIDNIIKELERLHDDAQGIFDAHVDHVRTQMPGVPFGVVKNSEIAHPAGSAIDYVAALKIVRQKIIGAN